MNGGGAVGGGAAGGGITGGGGNVGGGAVGGGGSAAAAGAGGAGATATDGGGGRVDGGAGSPGAAFGGGAYATGAPAAPPPSVAARRFSSLICCTDFVCEVMEENSESIDAATVWPRAAARMDEALTEKVSPVRASPSAERSRALKPTSSSSTRSPPMSVLIIASTGSMAPSFERPRPMPAFHPIFSRSAKPRPESTGRVLSFDRASLAAFGTRCAAWRTPSLPMISRLRTVAVASSNITIAPEPVSAAPPLPNPAVAAGASPL